MTKVTKPLAGVKHIHNITYVEVWIKGLGLVKRPIKYNQGNYETYIRTN